ncbi:hypothetical protein VTI74DRAFT_7554 [Chaetomium olivicolor]
MPSLAQIVKPELHVLRTDHAMPTTETQYPLRKWVPASFERGVPRESSRDRGTGDKRAEGSSKSSLKLGSYRWYLEHAKNLRNPSMMLACWLGRGVAFADMAEPRVRGKQRAKKRKVRFTTVI